MFKPMTPREIRSIEQHPISPNIPWEFNDVQVIYREMFLDEKDVPYYRDIDMPTYAYGHTNYTSIEEFAKDVALNGHTRNPPDFQESDYLGIRVCRPSYIVMALDAKSNWRFTIKQDGITLGSPFDANAFENYGALHHVDYKGNISTKPLPNCKVAYFAAMPVLGTTANPYKQQFNLAIDVLGGTFILVDPDIRFPGGGSG